MWNFKIELAPGITYTTDSEGAAVRAARGIAKESGECRLYVTNEHGRGYVSIYGENGEIRERESL